MQREETRRGMGRTIGREKVLQRLGSLLPCSFTDVDKMRLYAVDHEDSAVRWEEEEGRRGREEWTHEKVEEKGRDDHARQQSHDSQSLFEGESRVWKSASKLVREPEQRRQNSQLDQQRRPSRVRSL